MEKSIYPKVEVIESLIVNEENTYNVLTLSTTLRKEHEGKWYLVKFLKNWHLPVDDEKAKVQALDDFHAEVYSFIVRGEISEKLTDMYGQPIFKEEQEIQIKEDANLKRELTKMDTSIKNKIKEIIKDFYFAARASICHCFDHTKGVFPDDCDCEARQRTVEAYDAMTEAYREALDKIKRI